MSYYYRARISNIPSTVTKQDLIRRLNIPPRFIDLLKYPNQVSSKKLMVVYVIDQRSEKLLRKKIREWHNKSYSREQPSIIKCQLERNVNYFDWENHEDSVDRSRASSTASNPMFSWHQGKKNTPITLRRQTIRKRILEIDLRFRSKNYFSSTKSSTIGSECISTSLALDR